MEHTPTSVNTAETGHQVYAELNDMTPHEIYEAVKAGHFNVRGE